MPIPLMSFTKSKWLAFFAELTAKITHHNVTVVMEGCEVIKRILVSYVSVAAFLEEGELLTHLVDAIAGDMLFSEDRGAGLPFFIAEKVLFTQLETLSLVIDMMVALHADREPYYCLLVLARAGVMLAALAKLLQRQHLRFFGLVATMVRSLLTLPLGREVQGVSCGEGRCSVAFMCHLQQLEAAVKHHDGVLQETLETLQALTFAVDGPVRYCSSVLLDMAAHRLRRLQRSDEGGGERFYVKPQVGLNHSECAVHTADDNNVINETLKRHDAAAYSSAAADETKLSINTTDEGDYTIVVEKTEICIPEGEYTDCFERLSMAKSHDEFLIMMNRLWCLTVAAGDELQCHFTRHNFNRAFKRFLEVMPSNQQDQLVFTSVLLWLSHMMSSFRISDETRDSILSVAGVSLVKIILQDHQSRDGASLLPHEERSEFSAMHAHTTAMPHSISSSSKVHDVSGLPSMMMMTTTTTTMGGELVERPSIALVVLSFLLIAERACGPDMMEQWIRNAGLFEMIESLIRSLEHHRSVLLDTPTTTDGLLSDEVYLSFAMQSARTEQVTLAALSCKLLSSIIWNHYMMLNKLLAPETLRMLQSMTPLLMNIGINNPTLTSAVENMSGSSLHHLPSCQRASRYTSLGECSLVALDACFYLMEVTRVNAISLRDVIPVLPALSRSTRNSIHPPLRASVYRCLLRLCSSPADLMTIAEEMPSVLKSAVSSVLEYTKKAPQWEAAAAAEWLAYVIRIASSNMEIEQTFDFTQTALPVKLLELTSSNGITYATAALLSLLTTLFEQQMRFSTRCPNSAYTNVILPYGKRSLECWSQLILMTTQTNDKLLRVREKPISPATTTKDALSRFLSGIEGISVQFSFVCSLSRGLLFLFASHPEHIEHFSNGMMCSLLQSVFALPPPDAIFNMLSLRFGVTVEEHTTLETSYEDVVQWTIELCSFWLTKTNSVNRDAPVVLPSSFFSHLCNIMQNNRLTQKIRAHVCSLVSRIASVAVHSDAMRNVLAASSGDLFAASVFLHPSSSVCGMQCRLVTLFTLANEEAQKNDWLAAKVAELDEHAQTLKKNGGLLPGHETLNNFLMSLSSVCSVFSFPDCHEMSRDIVHAFSSSLRIALGCEITQRAALRASIALARSGEGRRCLLHEVTTTGEPLSRSCFGRILGLTLELTHESESMQLYKEKNSNNINSSNMNVVKNVSLSERESLRTEIMTLGFDVCATACGKGGEPFVHAAMKVKTTELIESFFLKYERRRVAIPLGLFRLVAALSFHSEAQLAILRQTELMTILIETADNVNCEGTLSLLTLRNLCFNPTLKTKICQDSRILLAIKTALLAQPPLSPAIQDKTNNNTIKSNDSMKMILSQKNEMEKKQSFLQKCPDNAISRKSKRTDCCSTTNSTSTTTAVTISSKNQEIFSRKDLALTALWSLMYDNQRGKSYVRGVLNEAPSVNINKLLTTYTDGVSLCEMNLEEYTEKISDAIGNIKFLGRGSF